MLTTYLRAKQSISDSVSRTQDFVGKMYGYVLINDGSTDITINIGTESFIVKAGEIFDEYLEPFTSVTITNTGNAPFRAYGRG